MAGMTMKAAAAQERRRSILDTTARFVSQHGFWGLRLREVANEENMTEAGLQIRWLRNPERLDLVAEWHHLIDLIVAR